MTDQTPPAEPTPQQQVGMAQAAGNAAGAAVERGASPEEVRRIVQEEMAGYARRERVAVDDDTIQSIAHATIAQLEQAGAFEPPAAPPAGGSPHPTAEKAVSTPSGVSAPTGIPELQGEAPRRTTFADRFLGHKPR